DPDGGLLSYGLKIANSHHDWYKSMAQSLQPTIATYPADLQAIVQTAIELGIKVHAAPTQVTLSLDEHQEEIPTAQVWELPDGARAALLAHFPEQANYTDAVAKP
ncbi:MAG: glutamate--cysteine ligase, partial [Limosilactobacillus fermentum]